MEITDQLMELDKFQIYNLGLVLGLAHRRVVDLRENSSTNLAFLDAVVLHWLQRVDRVKEVSWEALVKALLHQRLGQTGIATSIAEKYGTTHSSFPVYIHCFFPIKDLVKCINVVNLRGSTNVLSFNDKILASKDIFQ